MAPSEKESLERDADRATSGRAAVGAITYVVAIAIFDVAFDVLGASPRLAIGGTAAIAVLAGARTLLAPTRWSTKLRLATWRRAFAAVAVAMALVFGGYVAGSILVFGVSVQTAMMLSVAEAFVLGSAYAFAPRRRLAFATVCSLMAPALIAVAFAGGPYRAGVAGLLVVATGYGLGLARRLHEEYWDTAIMHWVLFAHGDALARSQLQTAELIEKNPDAMVVVHDGKIVSVNAAWTTAMQRPADAFVGQPFEACAHAEDASAARAFVDAPEGAGSASEEVRFAKKDGGVVVWELVRAPSIEHEDRMASLVVARDVTERDRMRKQLALTERLASIGTLAAGVAHEINNPLTYVLLNLEHVIEELEADAALPADAAKELAGVARDAQEGARRVRSIVRDLKAFAADRGESELGAVDVQAAVRLALKMADGEIRHRARVELAIGDVAPVLADEVKLGQAFLNLLVNAAQAIPEGAAVKNVIRVEAGTTASGDVFVEVSDTGTGIAPERLARIFDPFFTTKGVGVGTGLGLSICHRTIRSFGGDVSVTSHVGRGTTFTVLLKPAPAGATPASGPTEIVKPPAALSGRVLVVDDEPAIAAAIRRALEPAVEVVVEHRARRALQRLTGGERFDLVLCDLMMPEVTGMDLYAELERAHPEIARSVVFMTGGAFTQRAATFLRDVPNAHVEKPFEPAKLRELVGKQMQSARKRVAAA